MSDDNEKIPPQIEEMLRSLLGPQADGALEELRKSGIDLSGLLAAGGLPTDPAALNGLMSQAKAMFAAGGTPGAPMNWSLTHDIARQAALTKGPDPSVTSDQTREIVDAFNVAEVWLDDATEFPRSGGSVRALSSAEWIEATLPQWQDITEPIASRVANTLADVLGEFRDHPDAGALAQSAPEMMRSMGSAMFSVQVGQAVGLLSREVFGLTDIGIPLAEPNATALLPATVAEFAAGLDTPLDEVRLFLATREAAHARLFTHVPWLGAHLRGALDAYARGIAIDLSSLEEQFRGLEIQSTQDVQNALASGVFQIEPSEEQRASLERLETSLALVEGWVEQVTSAAVKPYLPEAAGLAEMIRRRRASGGPAEHTLETLAGLRMRPRRAREAAELWAAVLDEDGPLERERLWDHPDLIPDSEDLDDPQGFTGRRKRTAQDEASLDAALVALLEEGDSDPAAGSGHEKEPPVPPAKDSEPDSPKD